MKRSLCPLIVLNVGRGISAFESQWQHWTVKRSLCPLIVLKVGGISAYESQWQHWTVKRSLCPLLLLTGGYICLECQWQHWTVKRWLCPLIVLNWRRAISAFECQWQHWIVKRSLCPLLVLTGEVYLPLSLNDNIKQWRGHSVLCYCYPGGISAFECQWQHWTVKRSLCPLLVSSGGRYISLWVSTTTLNSEEITLSSDSVEQRLYLPLSVNDNIEQWRDHSVLW